MESQEVLGKLGVPTELGTDTAWTFEPLGPEYGRKALRDAGWDGVDARSRRLPDQSFLVAGESVAREMGGALGGRRLQEKLLPHDLFSSLRRGGGRRLREVSFGDGRGRRRIIDQSRKVFPVLVAMEMLDRDACERVADKLGGAPDVFVRINSICTSS